MEKSLPVCGPYGRNIDAGTKGKISGITQFSTHLLSACHIPTTILGSMGRVGNKIDLGPKGPAVWWREIEING